MLSFSQVCLMFASKAGAYPSGALSSALLYE